MTLSKEQILSADDLPKESMNIPEWGGAIWLRTMTGAERDSLERTIFERKGDSVQTNLVNLRAKFCATCICDESGNRIFTEADIDALGGKSALVLERITDKIRSMNGFTTKDVDELVKN